MLKNIKSSISIILYLMVIAFMLRVANISFPFFNADEARIAYRAFSLSHYGQDELGRRLPFIFNSLTDYQLPITSYLASIGVLLFGRTDFGVRIPFIILGLLIIYLTYKISFNFSNKKNFSYFSASALIFSPVLIYLAKVPNDLIVLTFFIMLVYYLLIKRPQNKIFLALAIFFSLLVSKIAWFVIVPFVIFTLFTTRNSFSRRSNIYLSILCILLTLSIVLIFLNIPQAKRSFSDHNFSLFSQASVQGLLERFRGQGLDLGWSANIEKLILNKGHFLIIATLHWLSNIAPDRYFGQFDKTGLLNFTQSGALAKALIIPFFLGIFYILTKGKKEEKFILIYFIILTFPALFVYPSYTPTVLVLTLPFASLVIAFGFLSMKRRISLLVVLLVILEIGFNLFGISFERKNTFSIRPEIVKQLSEDIYKIAKSEKIAVSDNIVDEDLVPYIQWFNPVGKPWSLYAQVSYPYKFRPTKLQNIEILGSDSKINGCQENNFDKVLVSVRDKGKISSAEFKIVKIYQDSFGQNIAYLSEKGLCIK